MKFTRIITAADFHDPNELAEEFLNNGRKLINNKDKIIVGLSPKQSLYLEGLFQNRRLKFVPEQYTASGYYVNGDDVYSWHLQRGKSGYDQIVAIPRYNKSDYQTGNIDKRIEDVPRKLKPSKIKRVKQPQTPNPQLPLWDDEDHIAA